MSPWLRMSAWLLPGLALGWLALLATFIHSVGSVLTTWAATVALAVLVARRRPARSAHGQSEKASDRTGTADPAAHTSSLPEASQAAPPPEREVAEGIDRSADTGQPDPPAGTVVAEPANAPDSPKSAPGPAVSAAIGQASELPHAGTASGLRILTAAEAASVLRVDVDLVITAIGNGELPGNQIGNHWRVDLGLLARWLQGEYGKFTQSVDLHSAADSGVNPWLTGLRGIYHAKRALSAPVRSAAIGD